MVNLVQNPIFGRSFFFNLIFKKEKKVVASKTSLSLTNDFTQKNLVVDNMEVSVSITMLRYGIHDYFLKWHK